MADHNQYLQFEELYNNWVANFRYPPPVHIMCNQSNRELNISDDADIQPLPAQILAKECPQCKQTLELNKFVKYAATKHLPERRSTKCRRCAAANSRTRRDQPRIKKLNV